MSETRPQVVMVGKQEKCKLVQGQKQRTKSTLFEVTCPKRRNWCTVGGKSSTEKLQLL